MTIAIIGAGMAGLSLAGALAGSGKSLRIFDKGRGPGGRMSTRRAETPLGELAWDHGAHYFTARSDGFKSAIQDWVAAGACAEWDGILKMASGTGLSSGLKSSHPRYVGTPAMNRIIRHMAKPHGVEWGKRVARIEGATPSLQLIFEDDTAAGPFEAVIVATPCEQAVDLLEEPAPTLAQHAARARSAPCWCAMLGYKEGLDLGFDGVKSETGPLSWISRNVSKPGRPDGETWVLHASPEWSKQNIERDKETVASDMVAAFCELTGAPAPEFSAAHRWRYAQIEVAGGEPAYWDAQTGIGACGDWCIGPRIEAAWESGQALSRELLR